MERPEKIRRLNTDCEPCDSTCSAAGLCEWPSALPAMQDKLASVLGVTPCLERHVTSGKEKIWVTTSFSGMSTFEHALDRISGAFTPPIGTRPQGCHGAFQFWSIHEISHQCRELAFESKMCPEHIFGDICTQVPESLQEQMSFIVNACEGRAKLAAKSGRKAAQVKEELDRLNERRTNKLFSLASKAAAEGQLAEKGWCWKHGQECPLSPPKEEGDLHLEIGGNVCVAFTPQGNQGRWIHASAIPAAIWLIATAHRQVDLVFQECSHRFNTQQVLERTFKESEGWATSVLQLSPMDVGVPMRRLRNFSWTVNTKRLELLMPFTNDAFLNICGSPVSLTGHDFFCAPAALVKDCVRNLAQKRGMPLAIGARLGAAVLPTGMRSRLLEYQALLKSAPDGAIVPIFDLSQNAKVRPKMEHLLPSFLTGSLIWSEQCRREMLSQEAFLAFGWPVPGLCQSGHEFPFDVDAFFDVKNERFLVKALGNSVHCRLVGFLMAFGLSITKKVAREEGKGWRAAAPV